MIKFQQFREKMPKTKAEMIEFLANHKRYWTMNSWNRESSYANNIKIYNLNVSKEQEEALYSALYVTDIYDIAYEVLLDFRKRYDGKYQICSNGRSGGYLVLCNGIKKESKYKSFCTECGQKNYKLATPEDCKCGVCGKSTRVNFAQPMYEYFVTGKGIDSEEDWTDWSKDRLKKRVALIMDFDTTCDKYIETILNVLNDYAIGEETVYIPKTYKVLKPKNKEER